MQSLRAEVEATKAEIEKATRSGDYAKAGELQYGKLPNLQKELAEQEKLAAEKKESSLLRDRVTDEEIARIVARWTGIPVEKLVEGEREKLLRLPDVLHQRVIGQDEAVQKVSATPSCVPVPALPIRDAPSAASCSWALPVSARPSWPKLWHRHCSMTRRT